MKKLIGALALSLVVTGCANKEVKSSENITNNKEVYSSVKKDASYQKYNLQFFDTFDTVTSITIYDKDQNTADEKLGKLKNEFIRLHQIFDRYNTYPNVNNLKIVNDNAGIAPVEVSSELYVLIEKVFEYNKEVGNKLNLAIGPVVDLWAEYRNFYQEGGDTKGAIAKFGKEIPEEEMLGKYKVLVNPDNIILNPEKKTVFLKEKGMKLDVGSVAKGYATELVAQYGIKELGVESGMISAGGNVRLIGSPFDKETFKVAIQNPNIEENKKYAAILAVNDTSVVTSGDYERYFEHNGKRYNHIINPETLMPGDKFRSVSIITKDSMLADYLSTVLFLNDIDEGKKICRTLDVDAIWYLNNNDIEATNGAKEMMVKQ